MFLEFLKAVAMFISLSMCIFLFAYVYIEGLRISISEKREKVEAGTFLTSLLMAFVFGYFASSFY
ncbi:hypothetical protein [Fredinandcohnia quinoae]|uniref:Dolichyl-diphosphooligosaccharide-protein glycosyltransferase subunit OST5 n=1 Tax=Fredinandcohnia quinoae TaxID=2918902 RepID=A0AAW5ED19_9BACI|nr:hypothetical protein [Fredinandcohnia sp. SECRCQ15]MCH1627802.1 hypothetical protein [Fredinandcohnia sp. SECRCQ15]